MTPTTETPRPPWRRPLAAWNVFRGRRRLTTVYYDADMDAEAVRESLTRHDGYGPDIVVVRR